jgi:hypothetical protein
MEKAEKGTLCPNCGSADVVIRSCMLFFNIADENFRSPVATGGPNLHYHCNRCQRNWPKEKPITDKTKHQEE